MVSRIIKIVIWNPIHTIQRKLNQSNAIQNRSKCPKEYLVRGCVLNQKRLNELQQTIRLMGSCAIPLFNKLIPELALRLKDKKCNLQNGFFILL
jgi:hypothetical protein